MGPDLYLRDGEVSEPSEDIGDPVAQEVDSERKSKGPADLSGEDSSPPFIRLRGISDCGQFI